MTYIPQNTSTYIGNQVIINSDRLLFNAKNDSILLFSDKVIGFSTNGSFHFDTSPDKNKSKFILNSPNIYLGLEFDNTLPTEPAVLGNELKDILSRIINQCMGILADIEYKVAYKSTTPGELTGMNHNNKAALRGRHNNFMEIMADLNDIDSTNTKLV